MGQMGRRRTRDLDLPARMFRKGGRYYYGRAGIALGDDYRAALHRYAELETGQATPGTFADAVKAYREQELPAKARKTQDEYGRQLNTLALVFGAQPLGSIKPMHIKTYLRERGHPIAATREKALFSAVFNFARGIGLTDALNPCSGIRGTKSQRDRAVTNAELAEVMSRGDSVLAGFLELCYRTGQRPSDVLRMRRQDVQDGALHVHQSKTGAKVRIEVTGALATLLDRLTSHPVASVYLIRDARGQSIKLATMQARLRKMGVDWQIRDLRAKAATDSLSNKDAQTLLGHSAATTTDGYIRRRVGERATAIDRAIADEPEK